MAKIAVILLNLGGPDKLESVKPFLFNLFSDKAIISLPNPFRFLLAKFIASRREKVAQEIYKKMGGKSSILEETIAQKNALEQKLSGAKDDYKIFISMRYWHPFSCEIIDDIKNYNPDEVLLLPLYPQYSSTTTGSSLKDFQKILSKNKIPSQVTSICCYPDDDKFIDSHISLLKAAIEKTTPPFRILFSAHGLPKKTIAKGDPYQFQIEKSVEKIVEKLAIDNLDHVICYQSRVGPLEWLEPATKDEIIRVAKENISVVIVPIAFVSEHSETLVELDIEYKKIAKENNIKNYIRVPTLSIQDYFIESLVDICINRKQGQTCSSSGKKICSENFSLCPFEV